MIGYREAFKKASALEGQINDMVNGAMGALAQQVQTSTEAIKASGIAEEKREELTTLATMENTSMTVLYLSIGGMLVGMIFAWLIGRGIAGPVVRLCAAMETLAGG